MATPANKEVVFPDDGTNTSSGSTIDIFPVEQVVATASITESACRRLIERAFTPHELPSLVEAIFSSGDEDDAIRSFHGNDAQTFIDVMDEALGSPDLSPGTKKKCLRLLYRACGQHALLPRALKIPVCYDQTGVPLYRGGFADVWKGEHSGCDVAVKVIRTYSTSDSQKIFIRFCKEVVMWKTLQHPNVLPLLGVMVGTQLAMVSEWMMNGNINEFVRAHPDANQLELLRDATRGLIYIHDQGMIHGDLKGANIVVDKTGHACLADFGLLTIVSDPAIRLRSSSLMHGGTVRWMAPELIIPQEFGFEKSRPTKSSDCYALGMVIYETLSGKVPFHMYSDLTVCIKVLKGEHPPQEMWFTESLWEMLELCWASQLGNRPSIEDVLQCLEMVPNLPKPPSPRVHGKMEDADNWDSTSGFSSLYTETTPMYQLPPQQTSGQMLINHVDDHEHTPALPAPLSILDSIEHPSQVAMELSTSPSSRLVIQNPDGQPTGILLLPGLEGRALGPSPGAHDSITNKQILGSVFVSQLSLQQAGGEFTANLQPQEPSLDRGSELTVTPEHGRIEDPPVDPNLVPSANVELSSEPTLQELATFYETLRGKKVTLCASSHGSFIHHLSSYLAAWGLDVSHYTPDSSQPWGPQDAGNGVAPFQPSIGPSTPQTRFVLIDDNIEVLKESLQAIKADANAQNQTSPKLRPSLIHRPKSTPQLLRGLPSLSRLVHNTTIVHFTSPANDERVKDIVWSFVVSSQKQLPEVVVIRKSADPRRVLTELYTALTKHVADPFSSPIAISHATSASHNPPPHSPHDQQKDQQGPRPTALTHQTGLDRSVKSRDRKYTPVPPPPLSIPTSIEYFSEMAMKLGTSPSSGLVIQSPDGQPAGIFFLPGTKRGRLGPIPSKTTTQMPTIEKDQQSVVASRRVPEEAGEYANDTPQWSDRTQLTPNLTELPHSVDRQPSGDHRPHSQGTPTTKKTDAQEGTPQKSSTPPVSPGTRGSATNNRRSSNARRSIGGDSEPASSKGSQDPKIVPPISVLIVEDNPINLTILSTFMKKKKIKYDVAKNGQEAVQKWKSGEFHLILMDIQMPVMDGIQATKEIRRLEKMSGALGYPNTPTGTPISEGQRTPSDSAPESRRALTPFRSSVIIVALTASSLRTDRVAALTGGCNDFLTKPVSLQWLNSKIIEWGSIKALQMWADICPRVVKGFTNGQQEKARTAARKLHMPGGWTA